MTDDPLVGIDSETMPCSVALEDGDCLVVKNGSAIIEEMQNVSWAP